MHFLHVCVHIFLCVSLLTKHTNKGNYYSSNSPFLGRYLTLVSNNLSPRQEALKIDPKNKYIFLMCLFPWSSKWSSWASWGGPFVLTLGVWGRVPVNLGFVGWNLDSDAAAWAPKGTLGCVWTACHRLWCHNLMTRVLGRDGVSRRWDRYRNGEGWGACCAWLGHCSVANGLAPDYTEGFLSLKIESWFTCSLIKGIQRLVDQ